MHWEEDRKPRNKRRWISAILVTLVVFIAPTATHHLDAVASVEGEIVSPDLSTLQSYLQVSPEASRPFVYANSIILMDAQNGDLLYHKNADQVVPVASTTKMITAITARRLFKLDEVVTVSRFAANINGSTVNLIEGEKITVHSLLKALLTQSGNDSAFALADHYSKTHGGDYKVFVEQMNKTVTDIGLPETIYGDPAGLDDEIGRSTARSLAHTARILLSDEVLSSIVRTSSETIYSTDGAFSHELKNSNRLIQTDTSYYFPEAIGLKTGFTHDAGHCLVAAADLEQGRVIGVVLNTAEYSITASAFEMKKLFTWAKENIVRNSY